MIQITFVDLSFTIDIKRKELSEDTTFYETVNSFTDSWKIENITISGRPVLNAELYTTIGDLSRNGQLLVEKHK